MKFVSNQIFKQKKVVNKMIRKIYDMPSVQKKDLKNHIISQSTELVDLLQEFKQGGSAGKKSLPVFHFLKEKVVNDKEFGNKEKKLALPYKFNLIEKEESNVNELESEFRKNNAENKKENPNKLIFKKAEEFECKTYNKLSKEIRDNLKNYCLFKINEKNPRRCDCILETIKSIFRKKNVMNITIPKQSINKYIYTIGDYILENGLKTEGLFRISGKAKYYRTIPDILKNGDNYDPAKYSIHDNTSIFKAYIRVILNGLIPVNICDELYRTFKKVKNSKKLSDILFYSIFCFSEEERELIKYIKNMFYKIDEYSEFNKMTIENLVKIFTPSLFPDFKLFDLTTINNQIEYINLLISSDFENVPDVLISEMNLK